MKKALTMKVFGLKCDAEGCDYKDMDIAAEDYPKWINAECPKCGANLLTEADYKAVLLLTGITEVINEVYPEIEDDAPVVKKSVKFNGTGKVEIVDREK